MLTVNPSERLTYRRITAQGKIVLLLNYSDI